jgi:hypothetical protein
MNRSGRQRQEVDPVDAPAGTPHNTAEAHNISSGAGRPVRLRSHTGDSGHAG